MNMNRRRFLNKTGLAAASGIILPTIVPSYVLGTHAPSNRINIGMIGTGRQAIKVNLKDGFLKLDQCRVVAINDVDRWRMELGAKTVNDHYSEQKGSTYTGVKLYDDYRELIAGSDVDAVMVSTTDHWHAPQGIAAALAGKHVCMEKALSISFSHSKALVEAIKQQKVANRLDSEFRSIRYFWKAVELVHNGLIGKVTHVDVGVPAELSGSAVGPQPIMPVPRELNYDMWLGPAFPAPYTQARVHDPGTIDTRPGWLRIKDYCNGMITNWGAHLCDIALWGMKKEVELPQKVSGTGTFSKGLWNTIESFEVNYHYKDGVTMRYSIDEPYVKFNGENGWVKVGYPNKLEASNLAFLNFDKPAGKIDYSGTLTDKADFLKSIVDNKPSLQPIEVGHNVYFTTLMGLIAVELGRELTWNNDIQQFVDDAAANSMLVRPFREKWLDRNVVEWMDKYQQVILK
jgi:myo-inositol 2-dehydrogenase / D-chiro-inositol 1-dehydrogenase